jgi:hypothetical protein
MEGGNRQDVREHDIFMFDLMPVGQIRQKHTSEVKKAPRGAVLEKTFRCISGNRCIINLAKQIAA